MTLTFIEVDQFCQEQTYLSVVKSLRLLNILIAYSVSSLKQLKIIHLNIFVYYFENIANMTLSLTITDDY